MSMEENISILVVDDEDRIRRLLNMYLTREGYTVDEAVDGAEALEKAGENDYACILLDHMMPEKDGLEVLKELREQKNMTPIMMLTAKGEESDRVTGFETGADDYIVKPFSPREVILRVKAILRRSTTIQGTSATTSKDLVVFPQLTIDHDAHRVTAEGQEVNLTPKEYELLYLPSQITG